MKLVINTCYGGFSLSDKAKKMLKALGGSTYNNDEHLIKVVEILGEEANGNHAKLKVIEIPDGVFWRLMDYDGHEWILYSESPIYSVT